MPPLNHKHDVDHVDTLYEVKYQECNTGLNGDSPYTNDADLVTNLETALLVAVGSIQPHPKIDRMSSGLILLYEPHDDGEEYDRVVIKGRKVYEQI